MVRLLLAGGRVLDPGTGTDAALDVLVDGPSIVAVGPGLAAEGAEVVDRTGLLVTPALIDIHVHVMAGLGDFCLEADRVGVDMGVPVVVDGGTSGVATFDVSRRAVIDHPDTRTRVLAFMDPNQLYLATRTSSATACSSPTISRTSTRPPWSTPWSATPTWSSA